MNNLQPFLIAEALSIRNVWHVETRGWGDLPRGTKMGDLVFRLARQPWENESWPSFMVESWHSLVTIISF